MRRVIVALAVAGLAAAAAPSAGAATATLNCPTFSVVRPDPFAGFPISGGYGRQIFWARDQSPELSCNTTYHVFFSYLYNDSAPGYTESPRRCGARTYRGKRYANLCVVPGGTFRGRPGRIFYLNGTNRLSGFTVYKR